MTVTIALRHKLSGNASLLDNVAASLIQWRTGSKYFHAELIVGDKWIQADWDGVKANDVRKPYNTTDWDYIEIPVRLGSISKMNEFIAKQIDKKYDWLGIIGQATGIEDIQAKNRWFCSELVIAILQQANDPIALSVRANRIDPGELAELYS